MEVTAPLEPSRERETEEKQHQAMALTALRVTHTSGCHLHTGQPLGAAGTTGVWRERQRHLHPSPQILTQTFPYRHALTSLPAPRAAPYSFFLLTSCTFAASSTSLLLTPLGVVPQANEEMMFIKEPQATHTQDFPAGTFCSL